MTDILIGNRGASMALTKEDLGQIKTVVTEAVFGLTTKDELRTAISGLATKDELRAEVAGLATKTEVRSIVREEIAKEIVVVRADIKVLRDMLEGDARPESKRLDKVDKRSLKTQRLLKLHIADKSAHGQRLPS